MWGSEELEDCEAHVMDIKKKKVRRLRRAWRLAFASSPANTVRV